VRIERIGVVGAGIMGSGIAEVCARAGAQVVLADQAPDLATASVERITASLQRGVDRGKLAQAEADVALARITPVETLAAMSDRQLVIEAVIEDPETKLKVFGALDEVVEDPAAILASNTSSIPIMQLAMATQRRERVVGLHFFNPVPVMRLVEVVPSLLTDDSTIAEVTAFAGEALGKRVVRSKDRAGFVVNALLVPYLLSAIRMLEAGFATAEDIDAGMVEGAAHPMGPLTLTDLVGLDTTKAVAESLYEEFKEPLFAPPPLLSRMVDAGLLGRKAGRGFYTYD
jgi:3-hydroxybutyryl-CoA dehydrogenase